MTYINAQLVKDLEINESALNECGMLEALRVTRAKRAQVCQLIAYNTTRGQEEAHDYGMVMSRAESFNRTLSDEDIAVLFMQILGQTNASDIMKELGIEEDLKFKRRVADAKGNDNTYLFGGKSIYGTLIAAAAEKFGWTFDYIVWGLSFTNLQLTLSDAPSSIYLSKEERQDAGLAAPVKVIKVTPENLEFLKQKFHD